MPKNEPQFSAKLFTAKIVSGSTGIYIEYYDESGRHRVKCNKILKQYSSKKIAMEKIRSMANEINMDLANRAKSGSSTLTDNDGHRQDPPAVVSCIDTKLADLLGVFLAEKKKEVRKDTYRSYSSFCLQFGQFLDRWYPGLPANRFDKRIAVHFLDLKYSADVTPRTYNNYLKLGRTLFNWLMDHEYLSDNPFARIKVKKVWRKRRTLIPSTDRQRIMDYLEHTDKEFLLYLRLICISLIRPKEVRELRCGDIDLANHRIIVRGDVAKNHCDRYCVISNQIGRDLIDVMQLANRDPYEFLFYGRSKQHYLRKWEKLRAALNLPPEYQQYSFRDTGITDYLKHGVDALTVMQLAGHSDLKITSIYARHIDDGIYNRVHGLTPEF